MNKVIRNFIKLFILMIVVIIPFIVYITVVEKIDDQYDESYLGEYKVKYGLLNSIDQPKIVFVGGSSLPFGLRSDIIEKEIPGYKVVNFGLYAALGTKFMLDTSKSNINEGDIVIISPELFNQTYSMYFNPEQVLQATDGFSVIQKNLEFDDNLSLFYHYFNFSFDKIKFKVKGKPVPSNIYAKKSFNEYGDIFVERKNNVMLNGVDSTMNITINDELLDTEFINHVNDYIDFVRNKHAKVYFNFSPCNNLAINSSKKTRTEFENKLSKLLKCDLLSNIEECIIDYRYFYDTNFHLNSTGAEYYTGILIKNLKSKLGLAAGDIVKPTPPEVDDNNGNVEDLPQSDVKVPFDKYMGEANIDYVDCFEYKLVGKSYQIASVKDAYKNMQEVILPTQYNNKPISAISSNAFYGCINLKAIHIGKSYRKLEESSFNGCIALEKVYLYEMDGNRIVPASTGLLDGANKNIKIMIPKGSDYITGYTWSNYASYLGTYKKG